MSERINHLWPCLLVLIACQHEPQDITWPSPSSIRSLDVIDEHHIRYAGADGWVGQTTNAGNQWHHIQWLTPDSILPSFRSSATNGSSWFAASIASPAWIARTDSNSLQPKWVYQDTSSTVFLDAMAWWNFEEGLVFGDPVNGCLNLLITRDAGQSWQATSCKLIPEHTEGEAGFAASNGNICIQGDTAWVFTGGMASRCLRSVNRGHKWEVFDLPIRQGETMSGVFGASFADSQNGLAIGGHWGHPENNIGNLISTANGGEHWTLIAEGTGPGYRSCIQHHPTRKGEVVAVGFQGIDVSLNGGFSWQHMSDSSFYVARFSPSGQTLWLAGEQSLRRLSWDRFIANL